MISSECTATGVQCAARFVRLLGSYPEPHRERVFDAIKAAERAAVLTQRLQEIRRLDYPGCAVSAVAKDIAASMKRLDRSHHRIAMNALSDAERRVLRLPDDAPRSWNGLLPYFNDA